MWWIQSAELGTIWIFSLVTWVSSGKLPNLSETSCLTGEIGGKDASLVVKS